MIDKMSNTSRLVEKLRIKGLVEREQCPNNRRQVDIIITKNGLQLIEKMSKIMDIVTLKENNLTEDEAATLNTLLDKFRG
jgi:DNA-binding MarR family transcriptional regulator